MDDFIFASRVHATPPSTWSASWLAWCQIPPPSSTIFYGDWPPPSPTRASVSKGPSAPSDPNGPKCEKAPQDTSWCSCEDSMTLSRDSTANLRRQRKTKGVPAATATHSVELLEGRIWDWTWWWKRSESLLFIDDSRAFYGLCYYFVIGCRFDVRKVL